nr:hypothetical protein [uncultured Methanobrevibacter sp.]
MGIFDSSVNLEKEQKMLEKYDPYAGLTAAVKVSNQNVIIRKTQFRLAQKGVVIFQGNMDDSDMRIPWNEIKNCGWNDIVVDAATAPGLVINLKNNVSVLVRFHARFGIGRFNMIHLIRGVTRIIESNMGNEENLDD